MSYRSALLACFASLAVISIGCGDGSNGTGTAGSSAGSSAGGSGGTGQAGMGGSGPAGMGGSGPAGSGGSGPAGSGGTGPRAAAARDQRAAAAADQPAAAVADQQAAAAEPQELLAAPRAPAATRAVAVAAGPQAARAGGRGGAAGGAGGQAGGGSFSLTSPDHAEGAKFGKMFTCDMNNGTFGAGLLPQLNWTGVPAGTMSFAITFIDTTIGENSAMGQHWAIWNIPWNPSTGVVSTIRARNQEPADRGSGDCQAKRSVPGTLCTVAGEQHGRQLRVHHLRAFVRDPERLGHERRECFDGSAGGHAAWNGEAARTRRPQRQVVAERAGFAALFSSRRPSIRLPAAAAPSGAAGSVTRKQAPPLCSGSSATSPP